MANIEVANAAATFPVGTTVKAFPKKGVSTFDPSTGAPPGTELGSAAVASSGALTITGATEGTSYWLAAEVSSVWRYMSVRVDATGETTVIATQATGDFAIMTAGKGLRVKEGSNAKQGISGAMVAGVVVVANTSVTAESRILLTRQEGGTNPGAVYVNARTAATSFEIKSTNASDTGIVAYQIFEPA